MPTPEQTRHALTAPFLCAVADGMGGHRAGEVASRYVARRLAADGERHTNARVAAETLKVIDAELYSAMRADENLLGMGTTVVGFVLAPGFLWFNVGDSRLYRIADRHLTQVSVDDTPPGPRSGLITQSLGGSPPPPGSAPSMIAPHVGEEELTVPARYLLCSDGLTDMLDDEDIEGCLTLVDMDAVAQLFDRAMRAGGADNISIVLVSIEPEPA
jgi:serine/threonine protein phosphatase PrpC